MLVMALLLITQINGLTYASTRRECGILVLTLLYRHKAYSQSFGRRATSRDKESAVDTLGEYVGCGLIQLLYE